MDDIEWREFLKLLVNSVVSSIDEPLFSDLMVNLFYPMISDFEDVEATGPYEAELQHVVRMRDGFKKITIEYPQFDNNLYEDYFISILKRRDDFIFEANELPNEMKLGFACYIKSLMLKELRIQSNLQKEVVDRFEYIDKQILRFNEGKVVEDEDLDRYAREMGILIKEQIRNFTEADKEQYLFDESVIRKINERLRPKFIDEESSDLLSLFVLNNWKVNNQPIDWKKQKNALIYLIYRLNKNSEDLPGGEKIQNLIYSIFTVKGKKTDPGNLRRQFSSEKPSFDDKWKQQCYLEIDEILK